MSTNTLNYQYNTQSQLTKIDGKENLFLSKFNEVQKNTAPCFFWGKLNNPYELSRCLITLSTIVQSSFNLSPFQLALLKDPIVSAGNDQIRFEGFSHCAGVYARVDVLEDGQDGEFIANGTTNVDFNTPMISALGRVKRNDNLVLSVGEKEVGIHKDGESVIERKVPLPTKWIKGLTTVQYYLADSEQNLHLNRVQAIQLFRSIPKGKVKTPYSLIRRGTKYSFSPVKAKDVIQIGGIHRLHLLTPLIPLIKGLRVFAHQDLQAVTFVLEFNELNFIFSVSKDSWRGFSGEGAALESLIEDIPDTLIRQFDNFSYANQVFNPTLLAVEHDLNIEEIDSLAAKLSAMGLLGFDLTRNQYFHRRLPFQLNRIMSLNPRLKGVEKLLTENKVEIVSKDSDHVEAYVQGSGVKHFVVLKGTSYQCTCTWFSQNQGERGPCKHILAVKKKAYEY